MKIMKAKKNNKLAIYILSACTGFWVFMTVGCSHSTQERTQLKEEIKREIRTGKHRLDKSERYNIVYLWIYFIGNTLTSTNTCFCTFKFV